MTPLDIYVAATKVAMHNGQVVGERQDYYVTLQQLEEICRSERLTVLALAKEEQR